MFSCRRCTVVFLFALIACAPAATRNPSVANVVAPSSTATTPPTATRIRPTRTPAPTVTVAASTNTPVPPTRTPQAAITVAPTATAIRPATVTVANGGNVRQEPRVAAGNVLDQINAGESVMLLAHSADAGWYNVADARGIQGWVSVSLLDITTDVLARVPLDGSRAAAAMRASVPVPAGWTRYPRPTDGYALNLPNGWRTLDLTNNSWQAEITDIAQGNPQWQSYLEGRVAQMQKQRISFAAFDTTAPSDSFATNLNVYHCGCPVPPDLSQLARAISSQMQSLLERPPVQRPFHTLAGDGVELSLELTTTVPGLSQPFRASVLMYIVHQGGQLYMFAYNTPTEHAATMAPIFHQSAASFAGLLTLSVQSSDN